MSLRVFCWHMVPLLPRIHRSLVRRMRQSGSLVGTRFDSRITCSDSTAASGAHLYPIITQARSRSCRMPVTATIGNLFLFSTCFLMQGLLIATENRRVAVHARSKEKASSPLLLPVSGLRAYGTIKQETSTGVGRG